MKAAITKESLRTVLPVVQSICETNATMPMLSHFLLKAEGPAAGSITATDLTISIRFPIEVTASTTGAICIPAKKLHEIVKEAEGDLINFEMIDETWLKLTFGKSTFKLACLPAADFPEWPHISETNRAVFPSKDLADMIEKTIYASAESDARYTLNGLLMHLRPNDGEATFVATDGHRLALATVKNQSLSGEEIKVILPKKAAAQVSKILNGADITCVLGEQHILFDIGNISLAARRIEGTYPDYASVIPKSNSSIAVIGREALYRSLRKVSIMSKDRGNEVKCIFEQDGLNLHSANTEFGEASDHLSISYKGERTVMGFNARYLMDSIEELTSENVDIAFSGDLAPAIITESGKTGECLSVVMPMRL